MGEANSETSNVAMKLKILKSIDEPIVDLSVSDICRKAGISRQTFYRYFDSKYDVLYWWMSFCCTFYFDKIGIDYSWEEAYLRQHRLLMKGAQWYQKGFSLGDDTVKNYGTHPSLIRQRDIMVDTVQNHFHQEVSEELYLCMTDFMQLSVEVNSECLKSGMLFDRMQYNKRALSIIPPMVYDALQLPEARNRTQMENYRRLDELDKQIEQNDESGILWRTILTMAAN